MDETYKLTARKFKYDNQNVGRHSPGHDFFVGIYINGRESTEDDFTAWEDLTESMADFIVRKINSTRRGI